MKLEQIGGETMTVSGVISYMLGPMNTLYRNNIDKIVGPYGVSAAQSPLLMLLAGQDGQCQKDLADKLDVKPSSLTTMLNRMEKTGVLERRQSETDHRSFHVFLTAKGRRAAQKLGAVVRFTNERNLAGFRSEEKILLLRLLEHMAQNMERQRYELTLIREEEMLLQEYRQAREGRQAEAAGE